MHIPVLLNETIEAFSPKSNENYIDCTIGGGGHSLAILKKTSPNGKVLGIDLSSDAIEKLKKRRKKEGLLDRLILVNNNFINLKKIILDKDFKLINGILFDFGISSNLLEESNRGFTFMKEEPLDMRFNPEKTNLTAEKIINNFSKKEIEDIFKKYGEERWGSKIAYYIVKERRNSSFKTTNDLRRVVELALGGRFHIKSLARIFQALRIEVNDELENIKKGLFQAFNILPLGGKIVTITFHSLEDKIVKDFFKENTKLEPIYKKPITPTKKELKNNNRARSAKLRAAQKSDN